MTKSFFNGLILKKSYFHCQIQYNINQILILSHTTATILYKYLKKEKIPAIARTNCGVRDGCGINMMLQATVAADHKFVWKMLTSIPRGK